MNKLRDKFALAAMQGYMSTQTGVDSDAESIAYVAYAQADAMLARRDDCPIKEEVIYILQLISSNSESKSVVEIFDLIRKNYNVDV